MPDSMVLRDFSMIVDVIVTNSSSAVRGHAQWSIRFCKVVFTLLSIVFLQVVDLGERHRAPL